ncbi:MAG: FAD:protein FMN transferase [Bdellovibrionales bacterium]|nr:FAD:protein FMN transferase [Bdellovibrionales bacterium]
MSKVILIFTLFLVSCTTFEKPKRLVRSQIHMGTKVSISGLKQIHDFDQAFNAIAKVDQTLSTYIKNSPVVRLNKGEKVLITSDFKDYLELSAYMQKQTHYLFDPTIGGFTTDFKNHNNYTSSSKNINLQKILNNASDALVLPKDVRLDFGGIGKGFALWEVTKLFQESEDPFTVKLSGDIYCHKPCRISVDKPVLESKKISFSTCSDKVSISTSGNYRNFIKNKNKNHLLHPHTGQSQQKTASITVVTVEPPYVADALATALAVAKDNGERNKIIKNFKASYIHISNNKTYEYGPNYNHYFCSVR